jgi:hypothetical protein
LLHRDKFDFIAFRSDFCAGNGWTLPRNFAPRGESPLKSLMTSDLFKTKKLRFTKSLIP